MERATGAELMDQPVEDRSDLAVALRDLRGVNRWLGGWRVLRSCMRSLLQGLPPGGTYRVLDIGTGSGDLPLQLARWARRRGLRLDILATDNHPQTLELARAHTAQDPDVQVGWADALALPFADREFDFALCSTMLHHFEGDDAARVLRELDRVATYGMVVNDLRRSRSALLGARLLAATVWRSSRLTRHDGPLSVRKAFTPAELHAAARGAGLDRARVRTHPPFRLSLVVDRTGRA
jgi:2-polyprenyl-3-methyl-5-hydroxy-6-metoxy-1,4-benzoquinol methylase